MQCLLCDFFVVDFEVYVVLKIAYTVSNSLQEKPLSVCIFVYTEQSGDLKNRLHVATWTIS